MSRLLRLQVGALFHTIFIHSPALQACNNNAAFLQPLCAEERLGAQLCAERPRLERAREPPFCAQIREARRRGFQLITRLALIVYVRPCGVRPAELMQCHLISLLYVAANKRARGANKWLPLGNDVALRAAQNGARRSTFQRFLPLNSPPPPLLLSHAHLADDGFDGGQVKYGCATPLNDH